jgi:uncharacterized membrane protein
MNLKTNKNLCGVGAVLVVLSGILFFGNLLMNWHLPRVGLTGSAPGGPTPAWSFGAGIAVSLCVTGIVLLALGFRGFAENYKEAAIFKNIAYALITAIIGAAVFFVTGTVIDLILIDLTRMTLEQTVSVVFVVFFVPFVLISAFLVAAFMFLRRSLSALATKTGVDTFKAASLVLLIGAVLTVIAAGVILIWVGFIVLAVGFFSIRTIDTQTMTTP